MSMGVLLQYSMRYQELQIERQLLRSNIDTAPLNVLQRNSITHLKQTQENTNIFYHSIDQHQQALRLLIFALLAKIFTAYSLANARRLQTLKQIVYSSPLSTEITDGRGIEKNQLLKLFAQKINSLTISSQVQVNICNLMNNSAFFEEILLLAFEQAILSWLKQQKKEEEIAWDKQKYELELKDCVAFMNRHFDLEFRILPFTQTNSIQQENQILLYCLNQHLYKKSNKNIEISSVSSSSVKETNVKENQPPFTLESVKMNNTVSLEEMSPLHFSAKNRSSPNYSEQSGRKPLVENSSEKKRRKKKQEESSSFFSLFCCCN